MGATSSGRMKGSGILVRPIPPRLSRLPFPRRAAVLLLQLDPLGLHFAHQVWLLAGQIDLFAAVGGEVEELPGVPVFAGGDQLPVAHPERTVALVMEEQHVAGRHCRRERRRARGFGRARAARRRRRRGSAGFAPATSSSVGTKSITWPTSWRSSPRAAIPFGQWTTSGVEMPPSLTQILCRRNGALLALAQPGPRHRNDRHEPGGASRSWPSPRTRSEASAPLSERKKISVLSKAPIARS